MGLQKNGNLIPEHVTAHSGRYAWWLCQKCNRSWKTIISHRTAGSGCPFCAGLRPIPGINDLASKPELALEWDYEKNGDLTPEKITAKSSKSVWWKCSKCNRSWKTAICHRTNGSGCPFCAGLRLISGINDLASKPELALEWDYEKNGDLTPEKITAKSSKSVWWRCKNCNYSWRTSVSNRSYSRGCPRCAGKIVTPGKNDFATLFPTLNAELAMDLNGSLTPTSISPNSTKRVWWRCRICNREWDTMVVQRTRYGSGCPYCAGKRPIPGINTLDAKRPEIALDWDYERNVFLKPSQFLVSSNAMIWWKCKFCGHNWKATIYNRTRSSRCPHCHNF